jgi:hypothetical protein
MFRGWFFVFVFWVALVVWGLNRLQVTFLPVLSRLFPLNPVSSSAFPLPFDVSRFLLVFEYLLDRKRPLFAFEF